MFFPVTCGAFAYYSTLNQTEENCRTDSETFLFHDYKILGKRK